MPSGRLLAWIAAISLLTTVGLEKFRAKGAGAATGARVAGLRRPA